MADIFLSYAREDRSRAAGLADVLERAGWSVWWDRSILAGGDWHRRLEEELEGARCVMVVWSRHSIGSGWVRDEAEEGRVRGVLIPVLLDGVRPPLGFRSVQAEDVSGWNGDAAAGALDGLLAAVRELLGGKGEPARGGEPVLGRAPEPAPKDRGGRVEIRYEAEMGGATVQREVPLLVGVLGRFAGDSPERPPRLRDRPFRTVSAARRDAVMAELAAGLRLEVPDRTRDDHAGTLAVELSFRSMSDFEPAAVAARVPRLAWLMELQARLARAWRESGGDGAARHVLDEMPPSPDPAGLPAGALEGERDGQGRLRSVDERIGRQLDEILHDPAFRALESSWRGLSLLLSRCEGYESVQFRLLDVTRDELLEDVRGSAVEDTALFHKLYEEQFGQFGAAAFGLLVVDASLGTGADDLDLMEGWTAVARQIHAPFLAGVDPELSAAAPGRDSEVREGPAGGAGLRDRWRRLRGREESRYLALAGPRILMRTPYRAVRGYLLGAETAPEDLPYCERCDGPGDHLWGNAAYALAWAAARSFHRFGWYAALTRPDVGGEIRELPRHLIDEAAGGDGVVGPTEDFLSAADIEALQRAGLAPVAGDPATDAASFPAVHTFYRPRVFSDPRVAEDERSAALLTSVLTTSRFLHHMQLMLRDRIGAYAVEHELEDVLNRWLRRYVAPGQDDASTADAEHPLLDASVSLRSVIGLNGAFDVDLFLRVGYQFRPPRTLRSSTRLVNSGYFIG